MNTSLPMLSGTGAVPTSISGVGENTSLNQHDTAKEGGFGAMLGGFHAELSESLPPDSPGDAVAGELLAGLQQLPEGGKLLPLLQETLDAAVVQGLDGEQLLDAISLQDLGSEQLLDKLSASLEALQPAEVEQVAESFSGLLQQLNSQIPATAGSISGEGAVPALPGKTGNVTPYGQVAEFIQQQLRPQTAGTQLSNAADAAVLKQSPAGLDNAVEQLQQQTQVAEGRQSDLALLMAAFKRQRADGAHRATADNSRPDPLAIAGGHIAAVATGAGVPSSTLPTTSVQTPFGQANWDQAVGERIQWMVSQKMQGAQVKLNPANLGPMEVRVQVQNDQASVQFMAHNAMVREALEAALPRLRDMFEASGVELVDVDVSGQSFAEQKTAGEDGDGTVRSGVAADADFAPEMMLESDVTSLQTVGRLDLFA